MEVAYEDLIYRTPGPSGTFAACSPQYRHTNEYLTTVYICFVSSSLLYSFFYSFDRTCNPLPDLFVCVCLLPSLLLVAVAVAVASASTTSFPCRLPGRGDQGVEERLLSLLSAADGQAGH